jgi:uncharacterized protein
MKIGVVSDTHDRMTLIERAVNLLRERGAELLIHCGDIQSPEAVRLFGVLPTHFVFGNWDGDHGKVRIGIAPKSPDEGRRDTSRLRAAIEEAGGTVHDQFGYLRLDARDVAWVHGDDRDLLRELERCDAFDYLFYGHTHYPEQHRVGKTLVANPGALFRVQVSQCLLLDLATDTLEAVRVD